MYKYNILSKDKRFKGGTTHCLLVRARKVYEVDLSTDKGYAKRLLFAEKLINGTANLEKCFEVVAADTTIIKCVDDGDTEGNPIDAEVVEAAIKLKLQAAVDSAFNTLSGITKDEVA